MLKFRSCEVAATKLSTGYRYSYRTIMIAFFAFFAPVLSFRDEEDEESGSRSRGWSTHPTTQGENPQATDRITAGGESDLAGAMPCWREHPNCMSRNRMS